MALLFRTFTKEDWWAFSGAEPYADGRDPSIAELSVDGALACAILDAEGLRIILGPELGDSEIYIPREEDGFGPAGDLVISDALSALRPEISSIALEVLGFRTLGGGPYNWRILAEEAAEA